MITAAIIGFGNRGSLYADIIKDSGGKAKVTAVCDKALHKLDYAVKDFSVDRSGCFSDENEFFAKKRADILIIATQDTDHYLHAMKALDLGYDLLLEKPISPSLNEILEISKKADALKRKVAVCHVLRYTAFYEGIKEIIDSGEIGSVVTINQTENVGYWHYAHSYVRGNWRQKESSGPMILTKCCHDTDIISWLMGEDCEGVSSYGSLNFFNEKNAPKNSASHCFECGVNKECPYNCIRFYSENPGWLHAVNSATPNLSEPLNSKLNPYARCVFRSDNNVVDHQVVNMRFKGDKTAHLTMTAFSSLCTRKIAVHGTYGIIEGDFEEKCFKVSPFGKKSRIIDLTKITSDFSGHGGGDRKMVLDFIDFVKGDGKGKGLTLLKNSVMSHKISFGAEESRLNNGTEINF